MTLPQTKSLRLNCGVFGVFGHPDAAALTALGLHALQHRGQEGVGVATFDGDQFHCERRPGLVGDHFTKPQNLSRLPGRRAVGHVRYSTLGGESPRNLQPLYADIQGGGCAVSHNGHFSNALTLRDQLVADGAIFQSTSDTEVLLHLLARNQGLFVPRLSQAVSQIQGGFALAVLSKKRLVGVRDPHGVRPLVLGKLNDAYILASETCALDIISAKLVRSLDPGEMLVISDDGLQSIRPFPKKSHRPCVFEYIYFSRPDSVVGGKTAYSHRVNLGLELAREAPADGDLVSPVPDSGVPAALGYARGSGVPYELALIRNHYVGRTFILPTQSKRQETVRLKHNANPDVVKNARIILIDDSLVRGNTVAKIARLLRDAGAKEIHLRIASPPILYPDVYGIDMPSKEQLLAAHHSPDEIARRVGVDTLQYLSIDGLHKALGYPNGRNNNKPVFADHCFTGDYPAQPPAAETLHKAPLSLMREHALSRSFPKSF